MTFLPWDNPDNVVSKEAEYYASKALLYTILILTLIGGPANVINMAVFLKQGLQERANLLLFSLSVADEALLVIMMLLSCKDFDLPPVLKKASISLYAFLINERVLAIQGSTFVSVVLSGFIAIDRSFCVLRPLKYHAMISTRVMGYTVVLTCMIILALYYISVLRYQFVCAFNPDSGAVTHTLTRSEFYLRHPDLIDNLGNIFFGPVINIGAFLVVTTATALTVWKLKQIVAWRSETSTAVSPREVALTKMLVGTSMLFMVCVLPSVLFRTARVFLTEMNVGRRHHNLYLLCLYITIVSVMINSTFNFFIYYAMGSRYRQTFWALFCPTERGTDRKIRGKTLNE